MEVILASTQGDLEGCTMFDRNGYNVMCRNPIRSGPNLDKIIDSHREFLEGTLDLLDFTIYDQWSGGRTNPLRVAVAGIEKCGGEGVNLRLQTGLRDEGVIYQALGYNFNKFKGNLEELKRTDKGPIWYEPVRLPETGEMMALSDKEFVAVILMKMSMYKLPVFCQHPDCKFVIFNPADLRRFYGRNLCPCHFPLAVRGDTGSDTAYLKRVARLLPSKPIAVNIYPKGIFEHACP
jgi:hypothetical protein